MPKTRKICLLIATFILFSCPTAGVFAQQTIINVPSSEVLPFGDIILKESTRVMPDDFVRLTPTVIFGLGKGFELATGVGTTLGDETVVRGDIALKKVFIIKGATRFTVGARVSPYFNQSSEPDSFIFSHFSHRIKKTKTTLTAGMYVGSRQEITPSKTGVLLGLDQVIVPNKLRLAVDYISGDETMSVFATGLKYRPIPTLSINSAVLIFPRDEDRVAFNVSISKFLSIKDFLQKKEGL